MKEELIAEKPLHVTDDKLMCRHGFHKWVLKDERRCIDERGRQMRPVQRCIICGKEKFVS